MSDDELRERTQRFSSTAEGTELDDLLIDAFATVREAGSVLWPAPSMCS
jgi:preprotein translocase subunit SecA